MNPHEYIGAMCYHGYLFIYALRGLLLAKYMRPATEHLRYTFVAHQTECDMICVYNLKTRLLRMSRQLCRALINFQKGT